MPVDLGDELVEHVEPRLLGAPVVPVAPVGDEIADLVDRGAVSQPVPGIGVGKAGELEAAAQVVEHRVVDLDAERLDASLMALA